MIRTKVNPLDVARRAFLLAWEACGGPLGMGVLQDRPEAQEEDIWSRVCNPLRQRDGVQMVYGDYVFGRMMKLGMTISSEGIDIPRAFNPAYNGFAHQYPTPEVLIAAAVASLTEVSA